MAGIFYYPTVNGKESQKFAGLPYLDYGAKFCHPPSSRWTTMDPTALLDSTTGKYFRM